MDLVNYTLRSLALLNWNINAEEDYIFKKTSIRGQIWCQDKDTKSLIMLGCDELIDHFVASSSIGEGGNQTQSRKVNLLWKILAPNPIELCHTLLNAQQRLLQRV